MKLKTFNFSTIFCKPCLKKKKKKRELLIFFKQNEKLAALEMENY